MAEPPTRRDHALERELQAALDGGHRVWAVGDVHGHPQTLATLLDEIEVSDHDRVVMLGDLIDRGPGSAGVCDLVRGDHRLTSIKGNHEEMLIEAVGKRRSAEEWYLWRMNGGLEAIRSFAEAVGGSERKLRRRLAEEKRWMQALPSELVLDDWRLVHAGYDPRRSLDNQRGEALHWIRGTFHNHPEPVDPKRSVVIGHTITRMLGLPWGEVAVSEPSLDDGRPAWLGLDTCVYAWEPGMLTAFELGTQEIVQTEGAGEERPRTYPKD